MYFTCVSCFCSPTSDHIWLLHCAKKPVTTMLTCPWKCTVLHCNHLGNTWKPLVLMTRHFDYCPSASEGDNQSVRSATPVVSRCFLGGYNVKLYISRGRLAWWLLAFLCCVSHPTGSKFLFVSYNTFTLSFLCLSYPQAIWQNVTESQMYFICRVLGPGIYRRIYRSRCS